MGLIERLIGWDPHPEGAHNNQPVHAVQDPPKEEKT